MIGGKERKGLVGHPENKEGNMDILTPKEIANRYKISERQVTALARKGMIPGFRIGKLWRFRETDIETWEKRPMRDYREITRIVDQVIGEMR